MTKVRRDGTCPNCGTKIGPNLEHISELKPGWLKDQIKSSEKAYKRLPSWVRKLTINTGDKKND